MFTGLVEGRGVVSAVAAEGPGVRLSIRPPGDCVSSDSVHRPAAVGESIAVSGCCLTVVHTGDGDWTFQAGPETLAKTTLGTLRVGDVVNLERSLTADARLGGHFVQGHVDGTGRVERIDPDAEWVTMWFAVGRELTRLMVPKGSIAVDGVSLTLVACEPERFSVALIPHTLAVTTLGLRQRGEPVNIETDILGKYIMKFCEAYR